MSSRANLLPPPVAAAVGGDTATPPTTTTPRTFTLPTIDDPTVMAMRPKGHVGQVLLGEGGETNIFDAFKKALGIQELYQAIKGLTAPSPATRVVIGVTPGVYTTPDWTHALNSSNPKVERGWVPPFVDVIALDPTRDSATVEWGFSPDGGAHYWEGVNIHVPNTGQWEPKYPIHLANQGTNIWTRVSLTTANTASGGGGTSIGTDGEDGGCVVLHDVQLGGGTNQHGWGHLKVPSTCVYSKVTQVPGHGLGFGDNNGLETEGWYVDCTTSEVSLTGNAAHMHVNNCPGAKVTQLPLQGDGYVWDGTTRYTLDNRRDWPIPTGGLSARDKQKWGLS